MDRMATLALTAGVSAALAVAAGTPRPAIARTQDAVKVQVKRADAPAPAKVEVRKADGGAADLGAMLKAAVANFRGEPIAPAQAVFLAPAVDLEPQARQFSQQLRPALFAELRFLRSSCEPSAEQQRAIAQDGLKALDMAARAVAEAQQGRRLGNFADAPAPRRRISDAVVASAREHLSVDQRARFLREREKRDEDLKEAVIANLVVKVDSALVLSPEQRRAIRDSLRACDRPDAFPAPDLLTMYDAYFPAMLHPFVAPSLNDPQRRVWEGLQKIDFAQFARFNVVNIGEDLTPADEAELLGESAAAKKEAKP